MSWWYKWVYLNNLCLSSKIAPQLLIQTFHISTVAILGFNEDYVRSTSLRFIHLRFMLHDELSFEHIQIFPRPCSKLVIVKTMSN